MKLGIDVLLDDSNLLDKLKSRKMAVLSHAASLTMNLDETVAELLQRQLSVVALFSPQHGLRGDKQDNMIESPHELHPKYGIPVHSLYSETRRPTAEMMNGWDVLLVDLQDLGTRIYTYVSTVFYLLEAAAEHGKEVWILDRPNPVGRGIDGFLLKDSLRSFVGAARMPLRHGLTLAELAQWFVSEQGLSCELNCIPMENYRMDEPPGYGWPWRELIWVHPSPNASCLEMARAYPGTVLLEGSHLSEGRGTTLPLQVLGAPGLGAEGLLHRADELAPHWLQGARLRTCHFEPTFHKFVGELCSGIQIHASGRFYQPQVFFPFRMVLGLLAAFRDVEPQRPLWREFTYEYEIDRLAFDLIAGDVRAREWVDAPSRQASTIDHILDGEAEQWRSSVGQFLMYPPFFE